jgi:hypothetical protein
MIFSSTGSTHHIGEAPGDLAVDVADTLRRAADRPPQPMGEQKKP